MATEESVEDGQLCSAPDDPDSSTTPGSDQIFVYDAV